MNLVGSALAAMAIDLWQIFGCCDVFGEAVDFVLRIADFIVAVAVCLLLSRVAASLATGSRNARSL